MHLNSDQAEQLLRAARDVELPASTRPLVTGKCLCLGLRQTGQGPMVELMGGGAAVLVKTTNALVRQLLGESFTYTSIQVNENTVSEEHEDYNYKNDSLLLVARDFLGGFLSWETWILRWLGRRYDLMARYFTPRSPFLEKDTHWFVSLIKHGPMRRMQ